MPARRKIDRVAARLEFEAGREVPAIAEKFGVSRQAIDKLVKEAGWTRGEGEGATLAETATARRIFRPVTPADFRVASEGVRTLARMKGILDCIAGGGTRTIAAGLAGIGLETLRTWLKEDPAFARLVAEAEATKSWRRLQHLENASARGDVTATRTLLERDPASRAEWGPPAGPATGEGGPALVLNLVLATATLATLGAAPSAPPTIDHEPGPAGE